MAVNLVAPYLIGIAGLVLGAVVGLLAFSIRRRPAFDARRTTTWDSSITLPLLLGAAGAHLILIPRVELERQVLFGLYGAALIGVSILAFAGVSAWRAGAILFPTGSILAYVYLASTVHQADYVGLLVKLVELGAIVAAVFPVIRRTRSTSKRSTLAG